MLKRITWTMMAAGLLMAGCDAQMNQLAKDALDKAKQAQLPTGTASAPAAPAATTPAGTSGSFGFKKGLKWVYSLNVKTAGTITTGEVSNEISNLTDTTATITSSTVINKLAPVVVTKQVTLAAADPFAGVVGDPAATPADLVKTDESVTVAAGTFAAQKSTFTNKTAGAETAVQMWVNKEVGLVKYILTTKPTVALPAGFALPGGMDMTTVTTTELKSYTK